MPDDESLRTHDDYGASVKKEIIAGSLCLVRLIAPKIYHTKLKLH